MIRIVAVDFPVAGSNAWGRERGLNEAELAELSGRVVIRPTCPAPDCDDAPDVSGYCPNHAAPRLGLDLDQQKSIAHKWRRGGPKHDPETNRS